MSDWNFVEDKQNCLVAPASCTERLFINRKVYKQVLSIDIIKEK